MDNHRDLFLIGKISGPHGIRGQLRVTSFSGDSDSLASAGSVLVAEPGGGMQEFRVLRAARQGKKIVLTLEGFGNINEVLHLVGREVYVPREMMPPLDEGEYYWQDLIGLQVRTADGQVLGRLREIIATGSNDVYVVREEGGREYLIPALEDVVDEVDLEQGTMTVTPPEGLFDL
ncbi:MAG TPA: ribosome maturation factor RimM [Verrucomicrobiae bacterium]|nr:ribosome maturation factor RimM [Verrucomicrobiae bacterium]